MGASVVHEAARQPVAGDGLAGLEAERAALQPGQLGEHKLRGFRPGQDRLGLAQEQASGLRQLDAAADPAEQLGAVAPFQRADRGADRRLRQVQSFRRPRDMLPLGDGDEDAKLFEGHVRDR